MESHNTDVDAGSHTHGEKMFSGNTGSIAMIGNSAPTFVGVALRISSSRQLTPISSHAIEARLVDPRAIS